MITCCVCAHVASQNTNFERIAIEQGLSQGMIFDLLQTRDGFLWVATKDGLNRYDGYNFTVFKPDAKDPTSLSDRSITSIVEDANGYIWVGTQQGGLNRYDPVSGKFTQYLHI